MDTSIPLNPINLIQPLQTVKTRVSGLQMVERMANALIRLVFGPGFDPAALYYLMDKYPGKIN